MQRIENRMKPIHRFLAVVVLCGLFFSILPTAQGFFATTVKELGLLLKRIDKPQWRIGYNFTVDCPVEFRQKEAELKEMIVKALQAWLLPLRERYPEKHFTDDFLLVRLQDVKACEEDKRRLNEVDLRITFDCIKREELSFARRSLGSAPDLCIKKKEEVDIHRYSHTLVHEVGHAFGLEDTYTRNHLVSTGGIATTMGKQPSSIMAVIRNHISPFTLGEDDKNGILYLYKSLYEDHPIGDCFFPDYARVTWDGNCEPEYPLIFEAKHGVLETVTMILHEDPTLDINVRDSAGMTALHHAVERGETEMAKVLLAQVGIKVNLLNKSNQTPAQWARKFHQVHLAKMIEAHPTAKHRVVPWNVSSKGRLTTTWGHLKKRY